MCCPTYEMKFNECYPVCSPECTNGYCVEGVYGNDHFCDCYMNYVSSTANKHVCEPFCPDCENGKCMTPYECKCNPGYQRIPGIKDCQPICSKPCINGFCGAPERCTCNKGYKLLGNSTYTCEPVCEKICVNGKCTGSNTCTCHDGYVQTDENSKHLCVPFCEIPCAPYGECTAPDICTCVEGYRFDNRSYIMVSVK